MTRRQAPTTSNPRRAGGGDKSSQCKDIDLAKILANDIKEDDLAIETILCGSADRLDTPERTAGCLEAAFEDGDPTLIYAALGDVARARGMTDIARETGLSRERLYRALRPDGQPAFATNLKVLRALGLRISIAGIADTTGRPRKRAATARTKRAAA